MLGKTLRRVALAERFEPRQMVAVERLHRADRQSDAMDRQGVTLAQGAELGVRRTASTHIVFRMNLEEADRLRRANDVVEMRRLEADAGARWKT